MGSGGFCYSLMESRGCCSTQCVVIDGCLTETPLSVDREVFSEGWGVCPLTNAATVGQTVQVC